MTMEILLQFSNGANEALIVYSKKENMLIVIVYRQPDDSRNNHPSTSKEFKELLSEVSAKLLPIPGRHPDIFMCGDFNLPKVVWPEGIIKGSSTNDERLMLQDLKEFMTVFLRPNHRYPNPQRW